MTPDRLNYLIDLCFRKNRVLKKPAEYYLVAEFFEVTPMTLRRWRTGETPVPRPVEIVMEVFHHWPEVTAEELQRVLEERDAGLPIGIST